MGIIERTIDNDRIDLTCGGVLILTNSLAHLIESFFTLASVQRCCVRANYFEFEQK